jgi:hypothetical protein
MPQLKSIWQNRLTEAGAAIAALAALFFISFQVIEILSPTSNPYSGLWTFMVLPALLVVGLILIPAGYLRERNRRRRIYPDIKDWPKLPHFDPNNPGHRKAFAVVVFGTVLVIPLIAISSYQGYHYTESTGFCGQVCHTVMEPEHTSYLGSPHARVPCASCHIGPGASWYVKSKISGLRQVLAVTFNTFSRPIPTPISNLRPARETCEQCHWPAKFFGAQLRTRVHYASDANNTRRELRVLIKTGGADSSMGPASGIHWHMALSQKIEYVATDYRRQTIPWVRATNQNGQVHIYRSDGKTAKDAPPPGEIRRVDCMDCHNRPTHIYQPPDKAASISLETGRLDRQLPYVKKVAVEALTAPYSNVAEAGTRIESFIRDFYEKLDPKLASEKKGSIDQTVEEVRSIYRRNFFPEMKVDWRAYPDDIGHLIFDGCFRCHDNRHVRDDNVPIRKDCAVCHDFLDSTPIPGGGNSFQRTTLEHPYKLEGIHADLNCSKCHTGGRAPVPDCAGCHTVQSSFRKGTDPLLPGLKPTPPSVMADLSCDSCHDLSKGPSAKVSDQCDTCHDKGTGDMIQMWKDDAKAGRAKAAAAIEDLRKGISGARRLSPAQQEKRQLADRLQAALEQVDKAGAQHNTEFSDAVYQQIVKLAAEQK